MFERNMKNACQSLPSLVNQSGVYYWIKVSIVCLKGPGQNLTSFSRGLILVYTFFVGLWGWRGFGKFCPFFKISWNLSRVSFELIVFVTFVMLNFPITRSLRLIPIITELRNLPCWYKFQNYAFNLQLSNKP